MTKAEPSRPTVMLVEDDPDDQDLARIANKRLEEPYNLVVADDGIDAFDYLDDICSGKSTGEQTLPNLLLVDLAMPRMDGRTLLKNVRSHSKLCRIPVVMFTTSTAQSDIYACYELGCNSFIVKPMSISGLTQVFEVLSNYWFEHVRLPA